MESIKQQVEALLEQEPPIIKAKEVNKTSPPQMLYQSQNDLRANHLACAFSLD